jgi:replication factor C subunit 2/4
LSQCSYGDLRKAINLLQTAASLYGSSVSASQIVEIAGTVPTSVMNQVFSALQKGTMTPIEKVVQEVIADGYSIQQLFYQVRKETKKERLSVVISILL